jgi:hypothetical protein
MCGFGDDSIPMTRKQRGENWFREMYAIWAGRIFDILLTIHGRETKKIGREHCLSVLVWLLIITGVTGYFSGIYVRDFWSFFILVIILSTWMYAEWKAGRTLPESEDTRPGNI